MVAHHFEWDELQALQLTLPGGYRDAEGKLHRQAVLRSLTGREEEFLAERADALPVPMLVTQLLSRCVLRVGSFSPVTPDLARDLLVADRDYLLLMLRHATFGKQVQAVLGCPVCEEKMDLDFDTDQVPVERRVPPLPGATMELSEAAACRDSQGRAIRQIEFRLPTGGDQEMLAERGGGLAQAIEFLLARCVIRLGEAPFGGAEDLTVLNALARAEVQSRMEEAAPMVDWEMEIHCPHCGHVFVQYFDFAPFLVKEARQQGGRLYREVHCLALHYHWPESEILALTRKKRQTYLGLLFDSKAAESGAEIL